MEPDGIRIRPAARDDSGTIAALFLISSDGLAEYIWQQVAEPGESVLEAGARRYARRDAEFSYEHCLIADRDGAALGMAHSFPMRVDPDAARGDDPVLRPYAELEDDGSLYLSGVAVFPEHRGQGIGSRLMSAVTDRAAKSGLPRVSLICFERNAGALRLYRRLGFREVDRRPVVPHPCLHYGDGDAILLAKEVGPA